LIDVLVVDDHELVRYGISRILSDAKGIQVIGAVASGEEALQAVKQQAPDVVLMDVHMPGIGGMEATRKIVRLDPDIKVIAVTASDDNPFAHRLLQAGASGYLTKGADPEEMKQAILKVHRGQKYISTEIAQRLALKPFEQTEENPFDRLTEREMQIALMIVQCEKVNDIGEKLFLSAKTVNSHRYKIHNKLGISGDVELTRLAVRHGLIDVGK
jgi:two-component system invasion response regulator UvrY